MRFNIVDDLGFVYITGSFSGNVDFDPGPAIANYSTVSAGYNLFILKLDSLGNYVWAKTVGAYGVNCSGNDIKLDKFGNILVSGSFGEGTGAGLIADFDPGPNIYYLSGFSGQYDAFIFKLDNAGDFIWAKSFGGITDDHGGAMDVDSIGNIYLTGDFTSTCDFDPGPGITNISSSGMEDVFISKFDSTGNFIWAKTMGGAGSDFIMNMALDHFNNVITIGEFQAIADFDPGVSTNTIQSAGGFDVFISKIDASGNFLWAKTIGSSQHEECFGLSIDNFDNIYCAGDFFATVDFDPGQGIANLTSNSSFSTYMLKLNLSGDFIWAKVLTGINSSSFGYSMRTDDFGNVYTCGGYGGTVDFDPDMPVATMSSHGTYDIFISALGKCIPTLDASSDTIICAGQSTTIFAHGASSYIWLPGGENTENIVSGSSSSITYTVTGIKAADCTGSALISVIIDPCMGLQENQITSNPAYIFPNPNSGDFRIKSENKSSFKLINEMGQIIATIYLDEKNNYTEDIFKLTNGVYFLVSNWGSQKIIIYR